MRDIILELCDEDDYGSWELWWRVAQDCHIKDEHQLRTEFVQTVQQLVKEGQIKTKRHRTESSSELDAVPLDIEVLMNEVSQSDNPNPNAFYWFGK